MSAPPLLTISHPNLTIQETHSHLYPPPVVSFKLEDMDGFVCLAIDPMMSFLEVWVTDTKVYCHHIFREFEFALTPKDKLEEFILRVATKVRARRPTQERTK